MPKKKAKTKTQNTESGAVRRTGERIPVQLLVDYRSDGHYLFDFCKDLGEGGVFIQTKKPKPQGTILNLTFTLPDSSETLQTCGTVIWAQEPIEGRVDLTPGMGIQFDSFSTENRRILEKFVDRYSQDEKTGSSN
ncbi:MAG: TIGR02266 family protein [Oligoflexales bacterium]